MGGHRVLGIKDYNNLNYEELVGMVEGWLNNLHYSKRIRKSQYHLEALRALARDE
jgi:hypothetical protein